jgi:hypothetical protein
MENTQELYENCSLILTRETEILKKITVLQNEVREAVLSRVWTDFEDQINAINTLSAEFNGLEQEREELLARFPGSGDEKSRFYSLAAAMPPDLRNTLTESYRSLKMETLKVRMSNDALLTYLNEARTTVANFLEIAFPEHPGRIYSRQGKPTQVIPGSLVLNQSY